MQNIALNIRSNVRNLEMKHNKFWQAIFFFFLLKANSDREHNKNKSGFGQKKKQYI
jgi:hypothetical protein